MFCKDRHETVVVEARAEVEGLSRDGASTPWNLMRCSRGCGTSVAGRCMNSSGLMTGCVVPSLHGGFEAMRSGMWLSRQGREETIDLPPDCRHPVLPTSASRDRPVAHYVIG